MRSPHGVVVLALCLGLSLSLSAEESVCPTDGPLAETCHSGAGILDDEADGSLELLQRRLQRLRGRDTGADAEAVAPEALEQRGEEPKDEERKLLQELFLELGDAPTEDPGASAGGQPKALDHVLPKAFARMDSPCGPDGNAKVCRDAVSLGASVAFELLRASSEPEDFTPKELRLFKERFVTTLRQEAKSVVLSRSLGASTSDMPTMAKDVWERARPVVTLAMVKRINDQNLGWEAQYLESLPETSVDAASKLLGLHTDGAEAALLANETHRRAPQDLLQLGSWQEPTGPFDGREHWPACRDVLRHVRFQTCGNCWSHSTALVTESRLCIATKGKFRGRDAWLSQSYVAACRPDGMDYCAGGSGTLGFATVSMVGVPTGGPDFRGNAAPDAVTCLPQMLPHQQDVKCPQSCSPFRPYPRALNDDIFRVQFTPRGLHPQGQQTLQLVKQSIMTEGPILIGFNAFSDIYAYKSGIYKPIPDPQNKRIGGHAVTGMGFGPGYILCVNSWGPTFGDNGAFKIAVEAVDFGYFLPGLPQVSPKGLPMPLPASLPDSKPPKR